MIHAADRTSFLISQRRAILLLATLVGLAIAASTLAFERGPFFCTYCRVESPVPDIQTVEVIKKSRAPIDYFPMFAWATGTIYKICNSTHCTVYRENFESNWVGEPRIAREGMLPTPIDEGGDAGGSGSGDGRGQGADRGGGAFIGGGSYGGGGRTGSVSVGGPKPVAPRPTHDN